MKTLRVASLLFGVLALNACATGPEIKAETAVDAKVNMAGYKTYAWMGSMGALDDPNDQWRAVGFDLDSEVRLLIDLELRNKGLSFANEEQAEADLLVGYLMAVNMDVDKEEIIRHYGKKADLDSLAEGGIVIGLFDPDTQKAVWVGGARAQVDVNRTDEQAKALIKAAIGKIFQGYPK